MFSNESTRALPVFIDKKISLRVVLAVESALGSNHYQITFNSPLLTIKTTP
jgi:hypothetical protein